MSNQDKRAWRLHACAVDIECCCSGIRNPGNAHFASSFQPSDARSPLTTHHHPSSCVPLLVFSPSPTRPKCASRHSHSSSPSQHAPYTLHVKGHAGVGLGRVDGRDAGGGKKARRVLCHATVLTPSCTAYQRMLTTTQASSTYTGCCIRSRKNGRR